MVSQLYHIDLLPAQNGQNHKYSASQVYVEECSAMYRPITSWVRKVSLEKRIQPLSILTRTYGQRSSGCVHLDPKS